MEVIEERNFMAKMMMLHVDMALGLFKIPETHSSKSIKPINEQLIAIRKKLKGKPIYRRHHLYNNIYEFVEVQRSRDFLERSNFDEIAHMIGYDTEFIKRTFAYVQNVITIEKRLFDELKLEDRRKKEAQDRRDPTNLYLSLNRRTLKKRRLRM